MLPLASPLEAWYLHFQSYFLRLIEELVAQSLFIRLELLNRKVVTLKGIFRSSQENNICGWR